MINPRDIPQSARRWPGYRGDDALLNVELICLNCGHSSYQVEITTPATWNRCIDFLEEEDSCPQCNLPGFRQPARIYEGRRVAGSIFRGEGAI